MRKRFHKPMNWIMSAAVLIVLCRQGLHADELVVELKDEVTVYSPQLLLRDVAEIKSRSFSDQAAAEALELKLLDISASEESIDARSVKTRLVLAGWSFDDVRITGAPIVRVLFREPALLTDAVIEESALEAALAVLGGVRDDYTVQLQNVFVQSLPLNIRNIDGLMARVIPPPRVVPGRCIMQIQIWNGGQLITTRSAAFEIRKRQTVVVAKIALSRDVPIDERSVQFERRFVAATLEELDGSQVFGQRVRTNIVAGSVLQARDFQTTPTGAQIVVKRGDLITAYARVGKLETRLRNVEAMQDAGLGDNIKLMNRESDNLFSGKVVGPGAVRVVIEQ